MRLLSCLHSQHCSLVQILCDYCINFMVDLTIIFSSGRKHQLFYDVFIHAFSGCDSLSAIHGSQHILEEHWEVLRTDRSFQ